jgi:hypothetical protein
MPFRAPASRQFRAASAPRGRSAGKPIEPQVRGFFEQKFGHDFSRVRVHTGAGPAQSAKALNARAYVSGENIVFGANHTERGAQGLGLLAHELAHVVQQRRGGSSADAEGGAKASVEALARGESVEPEVAGRAAPGVYRQGEEETPPIALDPSILAHAFSAAAGIPAQRQPFITIPPFSQPKGEAKPVAPEKPAGPIVLPAEPGLKPEKQQAPAAALKPLAKPQAPPTGDAPSRLGIPGTGRIDLGLRFAAPNLQLKGPPTMPFAADLAQGRADVVKQQIMGNPPPGLDMGELVKIVWSIFSTHIAADLAAKMASKLGAKKSTGPQFDMILKLPSDDKSATVQGRLASPGLQALGAAHLSVSIQF